MATAEFVSSQIARRAQVNDKPSAARAKINVLPNSKAVGQFLPKPKAWYLLNVDTGDSVFGQFEATDVQESMGAQYANSFALSRQRAITQFLHGTVDTLSFQAKFFALFALQEIKSKIDKLKSWRERSLLLGRPPVLYFWIGDQHVKMTSCVITNLAISYDRPGLLGSLQGATVTVTLQRYDPYKLQSIASFDTRYHYVKLGDTFEMLAAQEYKDPMLGVELRQRHPKLRGILQPGAVVKLPAVTGSIRRAKIQPHSLALKSLTQPGESQQKTLLNEVFEARGGEAIVFGGA